MLLLNFGLRCEEVNFVDAFKKSSRVNGIEIIRSLSYTKLFKIESCWKVFNNRCTNRQTGIKDYNMYAMMFTHTKILTHMLLFYHAQGMFSPEEMMLGFEKWNKNDELHRSDLQKMK
jgi:hypothetical protein